MRRDNARASRHVLAFMMGDDLVRTSRWVGEVQAYQERLPNI